MALKLHFLCGSLFYLCGPLYNSNYKENPRLKKSFRDVKDTFILDKNEHWFRNL